MHGASFLHTEVWQPLAQWGFNHSFFSLNWETLYCTWWALFFIALIAFLGRLALKKPGTVPYHLATGAARSVISMIEQAVGSCPAAYYYFIASLFTFILICNALVVIPGLEEPTKDLNTTFALALLSFLYIQKEGIRAHGIIEYAGEYFKTPFTLFPNGFSLLALPFALVKIILNCAVGIVMFPMELLGKVASVASLSLRLFGNIFGSSIISQLFKQAVAGSWIKQTLALITGINLLIVLFFGLFEAFIQAFVFSILSVTYLAMAVQKEDHHDT